MVNPQDNLPPLDAWRARLSRLRASSAGLRSLLGQIERLLKEEDVARGAAFYWKSGEAVQKVSGDLLSDSNSHEIPPELQAQSFEKAVEICLKEKKVLRLAPAFVEGGRSMDSLSGQPWVREDLPLFNSTESTHLFLPLVSEENGLACLHAWYRGGGEVRERGIPERLKLALDEVAAFLAGQSTGAQSRLIADYSVQLRLLESVAGSLDPADFAVYVTNFTRRLTGASRVCLFGARTHRDEIRVSGSGGTSTRKGRLRLLGASGLDKVSERSAEAVFLGGVASALVAAFLAKTDAEKASADPDPDKSGVAANARPDDRSILVVAPRETDQEPGQRPPEVREYFEESPSDWVCALALRRADGAINGYLLCEGKGPVPAFDGVREVFSRLDKPLGRVYDRLLSWGSLRGRWAARIFRLEGGGAASALWRKRIIWMLPLLIVGLFCLPVDFDVSGDAKVRAERFRALTAPFQAPLEEVYVYRGQAVEEGMPLGQLLVEEEILRQSELASRLASLDIRGRLAQQEGNENEAALARIDAEVVRAELALVENRLRKATFLAPFSGLVVGPENFAEREGTMLQEGDTVFEVSAVDSFALTILLREQDFEALQSYFSGGETVDGLFRPGSDPGTEVPFFIDSLNPLSVYVEDRRPGEFRVAVQVPVNWTPESSGGGGSLSEWTGRVELPLGKRSLFFVVFRDFIHFLRMSLFF